MNQSLFLISKFILSSGNLFYRLKVYLLSKNLYLKSKFLLSTFQSLQLSNYPSVTRYSVFAVVWNWLLRDVFVLIAERKKRITLIEDNTLTEREVIGYYFHCGYGYKAIVHLLKTYYDISLSERTLKRRLQKYNLKKSSTTNDSVVCTIIKEELETLSQCLGYRRIDIY